MSDNVSAFGVDHGDFSKAFELPPLKMPKMPGAMKPMAHSAKEKASGFKMGLGGAKIGGGKPGTVGEAPKTSFNTGLKAGTKVRENAKPLAAGATVGVGASAAMGARRKKPGQA